MEIIEYRVEVSMVNKYILILLNWLPTVYTKFKLLLVDNLVIE